MFKSLIMVGAGGFAGSISRYLLSKWIQQESLSSFPYGTLTVNVLGCLIIGFLSGIAGKGAILNNEWRMLLMVGFCGGFTTFSTFAGENLSLIRNNQILFFLIYTGSSLIAGLIAVYLGYLISKIV